VDPSQIRARVIADHEGFRDVLDRLERRTRAADGGDAAALQELRGLAQGLLERLQEHMRWEEHYLRPALREADAWGEERAERLTREHAEQREELAFILQRLRDPERPEPLVINDLIGLIVMLREDMDEEERDLLDERVLRDDIVGIEVEAG